jgi:hypothetical protein
MNMKSKIFLGTVFVALAVLIGSVPMTHADVTITPVTQDSTGHDDTTFEPGDSFYLYVKVDDATDIAGAALTIEYNKDVLEIAEDNEDGEDYFVAGENAPQDGIFCNVITHEQVSAVPSIGNKDTFADDGQLLVSGATVDSSTGSGANTGPQNLFKFKMKVKDGLSPGGPYDIVVKQSEILNAAAGWGTDSTGDGTKDKAELVPAIVGAHGIGSTEWGTSDLSDDFFEITATFASAAQVTVVGFDDDDNDGLRDRYETNTGVWVSSTDTGTDPWNDDTDDDDLKDGVETNTGSFVDASDTGTDPHDADTDNDKRDDGQEVALGANPFVQDTAKPFVTRLTVKGGNNVGTHTLQLEATISGGASHYCKWEKGVSQPGNWIKDPRPQGGKYNFDFVLDSNQALGAQYHQAHLCGGPQGGHPEPELQGPDHSKPRSV